MLCITNQIQAHPSLYILLLKRLNYVQVSSRREVFIQPSNNWNSDGKTVAFGKKCLRYGVLASAEDGCHFCYTILRYSRRDALPNPSSHINSILEVTFTINHMTLKPPKCGADI